MNDVATQERIMVQGTGFEPAKHYALGPKPSPFDHSGTPAWPVEWLFGQEVNVGPATCAIGS